VLRDQSLHTVWTAIVADTGDLGKGLNEPDPSSTAVGLVGESLAKRGSAQVIFQPFSIPEAMIRWRVSLWVRMPLWLPTVASLGLS